MENKLKPCPFCGGEKLEITNPFNNGISNITCLSCCATGGLGFTVGQAKEAWNKRTEVKDDE